MTPESQPLSDEAQALLRLIDEALIEIPRLYPSAPNAQRWYDEGYDRARRDVAQALYLANTKDLATPQREPLSVEHVIGVCGARSKPSPAGYALCCHLPAGHTPAESHRDGYGTAFLAAITEQEGEGE